jgi:isopentenyldiphosphate isomerase
VPGDAAPPHDAASGRPAPGEELVDVLDASGAVVGTATRAEMRARNLRHRSVAIAVLDGRGRLLVHRRAEDKDIWPGRWDVACGGVVGAGEAWDDAARRELAEELGIDAEPVLLGEGAWADADTDAVVRIYAVEHDGPYRFADGEVVEARWVDRAQLTALRANAAFCPDGVVIGLPLVEHRMA